MFNCVLDKWNKKGDNDLSASQISFVSILADLWLNQERRELICDCQEILWLMKRWTKPQVLVCFSVQIWRLVCILQRSGTVSAARHPGLLHHLFHLWERHHSLSHLWAGQPVLALGGTWLCDSRSLFPRRWHAAPKSCKEVIGNWSGCEHFKLSFLPVSKIPRWSTDNLHLSM